MKSKATHGVRQRMFSGELKLGDPQVASTDRIKPCEGSTMDVLSRPKKVSTPPQPANNQPSTNGDELNC